MEIDFDNSTIRTICTSPSKAFRKYGKDNAKRLFLKLEQIQAAENLEQLQHLPGHYHELKGDRKGQWACTISGPLRLIFRPSGNGTIRLSEIREATIMEVTDYH